MVTEHAGKINVYLKKHIHTPHTQDTHTTHTHHIHTTNNTHIT